MKTMLRNLLVIGLVLAPSTQALALPQIVLPPSKVPAGVEIMAPPMSQWCRAQRATANYYLEQYLATGDDSYWTLYADAYATYNLYCNY